MERLLKRYRTIVMDSERWEGFVFRDGDIVISTPAKCGTTWTQTICALLIFQTPDLPAPVDRISPWIDQSLRDLPGVVADLDAQKHRRFIKTHTPFDGIPFDERVTYICVGRDPRDVAMSWDNHMSNLDIGAFLALREKAVGLEDLAELMPDGIDMPLETPVERFWQWVDNDGSADDAMAGLAGTMHHLSTFWRERNRPNVVLLHYGDLKADLEGQMRSLADRLGIDVPEDRWPDLVRAATFEEMRRHAKDVAPNSTEPIWVDADRFFNKGTNGQWRDLLDDEGVQRYEAKVRAVADADLIAWVHQEGRTG
jgi:hypothetical protein